MRILAFDVCAGPVSVAAVADGRVVATLVREVDRGSADILVPTIVACLDRAGWSWRALDMLAVTVGPGSFTGIRSGVAAARGLALAADRPVLPVGTLEAMAQASSGKGACWSVLHGGRRGLFVQPFDEAGIPSDVPHAIAETARAEVLPEGARIVGDGGETVRLDAPVVARVAMAKLARGEAPAKGSDAEPLYLRPPDARVSAGRSLLRR